MKPNWMCLLCLVILLLGCGQNQKKQISDLNEAIERLNQSVGRIENEWLNSVEKHKEPGRDSLPGSVAELVKAQSEIRYLQQELLNCKSELESGKSKVKVLEDQCRKTAEDLRKAELINKSLINELGKLREGLSR